MKLLYKRIFIFFSVALNIGFIVMAVYMFFNHPGRSFGRSDIEGIIRRLDLPADQQEDVLEYIRHFRDSVHQQEMEIMAARDNLIRQAGKNGPMDVRRLDELCNVINREETDKNRLFLTHIVELRNLLGDEKGARFYSLLLEHIKNRDNPNRR